MNVPQVVTPAAGEPSTLTEVKLFLREDLASNDNDAQITMLYQAAREHVEGQTSRRLMTQTLKSFYRGWPLGDFRLPVGPVASVAHVKFFDTENTEYTLATDQYAIDGNANPPVIRLTYGRSWPTTTLRTLNAVEIQYVAGYANAAAVPARLKNAVLMLTATLYRHRPTVTVGNSAAIASLIPQHFEAFLNSHKIHA